jgi:hypothetical protein
MMHDRNRAMSAKFSVGIMQPYFFPYWGHFALIAATDQWVVFDISQYTPRTWMNRNRILHPTEGWQYVTVPLRNSSQSIKINEAMVVDLQSAEEQIIGKLAHYKKNAPFYPEVILLVKEAFSSASDAFLVTLNVSALVKTCAYLGIAFNYQICSKMGIDLPEKLGAGDWAPMIASKMGVAQYVNPLSGQALFDKNRFEIMGVDLRFLEVGNFEYSTSSYGFEPNLSIIDTMMWNSPEEIRHALRKRCRIVDI